MTTQTLTLDKVIEHHLSQNVGQKLTPHLITGLVVLLVQNIHSVGLIKPQENQND